MRRIHDSKKKKRKYELARNSDPVKGEGILKVIGKKASYWTIGLGPLRDFAVFRRDLSTKGRREKDTWITGCVEEEKKRGETGWGLNTQKEKEKERNLNNAPGPKERVASSPSTSQPSIDMHFRGGGGKEHVLPRQKKEEWGVQGFLLVRKKRGHNAGFSNHVVLFPGD